MKITTKGRYAIAIMLELANNYKNDTFLSLKDISEKEGISLKYLEKIMIDLKKEVFFITSRGQDGGYKLAHEPKYYKLGDILNAVEKEIAPSSCVKEENSCPKQGICKTYPIWKDLNDEITNYLNSKTLADYIERND